MICFYARLKDSEKAYSSVKQLLGKLSRENMFTVSPAGIAGAGEDIFCLRRKYSRSSRYGRNVIAKS